jgi:hypothetical protein
VTTDTILPTELDTNSMLFNEGRTLSYVGNVPAFGLKVLSSNLRK